MSSYKDELTFSTSEPSKNVASTNDHTIAIQVVNFIEQYLMLKLTD